MISPKELIKLPWNELEGRLRLMTRPQVLEVFNTMASDDGLTATKIVEATGVNRVLLVDRVCGNPSKGIQGAGRSFMIGPAEKGQSVRVENGSKDGKTRFEIISAPKAMPANRAILALDLFGPFAPAPNTGKLREYSPDELAEFYAKPEKASKKSK